MDPFFERTHKILFESLQQRLAAPGRAEGFRALRHNRDLCPQALARCEDVLERLEKHFSVAYDMQGMHDGGTDVLIQLRKDSDVRYIALQIKADDEAGKGINETIKSQHFDALSLGDQLLGYYVLLCWSPSREDRVREVLSLAKGQEKLVFVVPRYAWSFLYELDGYRLDAAVRAHVVDRDPLLVSAARTLSANSQSQAALLCALIAHVVEDEWEDVGLTRERVLECPLVQQVYGNVALFHDPDLEPLPADVIVPDEYRRSPIDLNEMSLHDFEGLDGSYIQIDDRGLIRLSFRYQYDEALALAFEARSRYDLKGWQVASFLFEIVRDAGRSDMASRDWFQDLVSAIVARQFDDPTPHVIAFLKANAADPRAVGKVVGIDLAEDGDVESAWEELAVELTEEAEGDVWWK